MTSQWTPNTGNSSDCTRQEKPVCLPQVLIRGVHVGGMEEIKKLNDGGKLGEMLKGLPVCESVGACGCCGDPRFAPCTIYY